MWLGDPWADRSTPRLDLVPHWLHSLFHWLTLHWGDAVPAWLAVIVAAAFGYLSWRSSRRSKDAERTATEQAKLAIKAAEEATAAQKQIAEDTTRFADATVRHTELVQEAATAAERYPWQIQRRDSADWLLHCRTDTTKYDVTLSGGPTMGHDNHFDVFYGRGLKAVDLFVTSDPDRTVVVSWRPTPDYTGEAWTQPIDL